MQRKRTSERRKNFAKKSSVGKRAALERKLRD